MKDATIPFNWILPLTDNICIHYPNPKYFIQQLKDKKPFAFPRLTHGFWLAVNGQKTDAMCMSGVHGMDVQGFIPEILDSLVSTKDLHNFFLSIGLLDYSPNPNTLVTAQASMYTQVLSQAVLGKGLTLYDARMFKSMAISGEIAILPELCAEMHTIAVGSDIFSTLEERWNLPQYTHVEIPLVYAAKSRYEILKQIETVLDRQTDRPPIILFRAGSLAYWLIYKLRVNYPNVTYLDLGQVFNIWFLDQELDWWGWGTQYTPTIIKSCNLEKYYQKRLKNRYSAWYARMEKQNYTVLKKRREELWAKTSSNR